MSGFPGAFPTTPPSERRTFKDETPTVSEFHFTPVSKSLYPDLSQLGENPHLQLDQECEKLGFSKKLSSNVLRELDERASRKAAAGQSQRSQRSILSPRSTRYNSSHRAKFSKMESISSHYAAIRNGGNHVESQTYGRKETEVDKENIPSYDPNSKRVNSSIFQSATKRRRTELGTKEIHTKLSPSKSSRSLQSILNGDDKLQGSSRIPRSSSKQTLQPSFQPARTNSDRFNNSTRTIPSTSTTKPTRTIPSTTTTSNISGLTKAKQLPRSTTLHNLTKPTTSSLMKSDSHRSLRTASGGINTEPSNHNLSKSRSVHNLKSSTLPKPTWR